MRARAEGEREVVVVIVIMILIMMMMIAIVIFMIMIMIMNHSARAPRGANRALRVDCMGRENRVRVMQSRPSRAISSEL